MAKLALACSLLWLAGTCFGQAHLALCPRHIETPGYPPLARMARITGKITLAVTVDAEGRVTNVEATTDNPFLLQHPMLQTFAVDNMKHWTFSKPPAAPYTQEIVYNYQVDDSLPGNDGANPIVKVSFDLPDSVTISTNARFIDHGGGNN